MKLSGTSTFLRWVLLADAATSGLIGLLMTLGSDPLNQFLGLPAALTRYAGMSLLPFAVFLVYVARRENLSPPLVWAVIALNALWTADSILLLMGRWIEPTTPGYAFVIVQAFGVGVFAALEYFSLRKTVTAAA